MKAGSIQRIICLVLFLLWVYPAWAEDWSYYDTANVGDMYYDKSRIRQVDHNIVSVWTRNILSEKAKTKYYSILQSVNKAPASPSVLSHYEELLEIDYAGRRIKNVAVIFYDRKNRILYASSKSETGEWRPIEPNSVGDKLSNLVSWESAAPAETTAESKAGEAATPKKAVVAATATPDKKTAPAGSRNAETQEKHISQADRGENVIQAKPPAVENRKSKAFAENTASLRQTTGITGRDGHFIAYENQTVLDTRTNLMWAAKDNGQAINWYGAKKYCEKYRGGGYDDWRMPTQNELAGLYDSGKPRQNNTDQTPLHLTTMISLTACCPWASETQGSQAAYFDFSDGSRWWFLTPGTRNNRVIPVRSVK